MIKIKNLTKMYGKQTILKNASFTFPDSGLMCLLGASGCGKSTLLNMLAGFDSDYSGSIIAFDTEIHKMSSDQLCNYRRDNIGFVFQNYNLLSGYTVSENILLACDKNDDNTNKLNRLLERFGMLSKANEAIENLSGGQKQRVAIIRALIGDPSIILADEPTGALDRKNSTEIMELLREMAKERLVLVITHDKKICEFADEVVTIEEGRLAGNSAADSSAKQQMVKENKPLKTSAPEHGIKNFKVHLSRYIAVSLAISIGILAFMLSLSSGNMIEKSISDFKQKNTAFNNGYVKTQDDTEKILELLQSEERIENVYKQYVIKNILLGLGDQTEVMSEKYPMPKATENMAYGTMPEKGKKEIVLSPSLARKFDSSINKLIGRQVKLTFNNKEYSLIISGIYNAGYDDFFISSDIEKEFYSGLTDKEVYSVSYDVKKFEDIVSVTQTLSEKNIESKTAAKEVAALQSTFQNLSRLFMTVSILILAIGLFVSIVLLLKLQNSRYRELGLLSALGFGKLHIRKMIVYENVFLSLTAVAFNAVFIGVACLISTVFKLGLLITAPQVVLSIIGTGVVVILISILASHKLIHTEPAVALRK